MNKPQLENIDPMQHFTPGETVIVAVSGGVDSMVLFDVLKRERLNLVIAHVNHKQRQASDAEYDAVAGLAKQHGIPFEGHTLENLEKSNFQAAARNARRRFFMRTAEKHGAKKIALAHHLDDRIETFFMRLVKGSPPAHLTSFHDVSVQDGIVFVRPFANVPKSAIENYARTQDIPYFEDLSNLDRTYTRNRFRHDILPRLIQENPRFHDIMRAHFETFSDIENHMVESARNFLTRHGDVLPCDALLALPKAVFKEVLRQYAKGRFDRRKELSKHLLEDIHKRVQKGNNVILPLDENISFFIEYGMCRIGCGHTPVVKPVVIDQCGTYPTDAHTSFIVSDVETTQITTNHMVLWYNDKVFPLYLRNRKPGDTIRLSYGTKKIKDLFIDEKVPKQTRESLVLLTNDEEVLWIPLLKVSKKQEKNKSRKLYVYEVSHAGKRH